MAWTLRIDGKPFRSFSTGEEAVAYARQVAHERPDAACEIVNEAGKPYAPGASRADRDRLAGEVGY